MRTKNIMILVAAMAIFSVGQVWAVTCEECREIEKNKQQVQQDVTAKDKDLSTAFEKKEFKKVGEIRTKVTELRKKLLELRAKDEECRDACKPDVVKAAECSKIRDEIIKLEDPPKSEEQPGEKSEDKPEEKSKEKQEQKSEDQIAKIDELYRDLQRCNKDLRELKKTEK